MAARDRVHGRLGRYGGCQPCNIHSPVPRHGRTLNCFILQGVLPRFVTTVQCPSPLFSRGISIGLFTSIETHAQHATYVCIYTNRLRSRRLAVTRSTAQPKQSPLQTGGGRSGCIQAHSRSSTMITAAVILEPWYVQHPAVCNANFEFEKTFPDLQSSSPTQNQPENHNALQATSMVSPRKLTQLARLPARWYLDSSMMPGSRNSVQGVRGIQNFKKSCRICAGARQSHHPAEQSRAWARSTAVLAYCNAGLK